MTIRGFSPASLRAVGDWAAIERDVIDGSFRFSPTHGRYVGDHRFDGVVGDPSTTAIHARVTEIDRQLSTIGQLPDLDRDLAIDRRAMVAQLQAARFELTELRTPFQEPMFYGGAGSELDVSFYLKRPYAPLEDRLAALRRHLLGYGGYLEAARDNLDEALPRPNLEIAIEAVDGQIEYLDGEVRAAARDDAETRKAVEVGLALTREFAQFLKARRATANDAYALGEARFLRLLGLRDLLQLDLAELERMVRADIDRNRVAAEAAAEQIAPGGGAAPTPPVAPVVVEVDLEAQPLR